MKIIPKDHTGKPLRAGDRILIECQGRAGEARVVKRRGRLIAVNCPYWMTGQGPIYDEAITIIGHDEQRWNLARIVGKA